MHENIKTNLELFLYIMPGVGSGGGIVNNKNSRYGSSRILRTGGEENGWLDGAIRNLKLGKS